MAASSTSITVVLRVRSTLSAKVPAETHREGGDVEPARGNGYHHLLSLVDLVREVGVVEQKEDASGRPGQSLVSIDQCVVGCDRVRSAPLPSRPAWDRHRHRTLSIPGRAAAEAISPRSRRVTGSCVYAAYAGTIVGKKQGQLVIDQQGTGEAYATQYLHIAPGPKEIGDRVIKGEAIASVEPTRPENICTSSSGTGSTRKPRGDTDTEAVPVDRTRLLYHWEQAVDLDYAVCGSIDVAASAELDAETRDRLTAAYDARGSTCRHRRRSRRWLRVRLAHQRSGCGAPAARRARERSP